MLFDKKVLKAKHLSGSLFLVLTLSFFQFVHAATGMEWLATQTQADGSYSNPVDVATAFQSTS